MRQKLYIISLIATVIISFYSCDSDDDSSLSDRPLLFSADTIAFDTVFTKIGSATQHFKIYNRNSRSLDIQSIELASKGTSGFRINVDGESGTYFSNVEILKQDSLFVFVEITVNPLTSPNPIIRDSIGFTTNGITQYIQLEAIGLDVYKWDDKEITQDTTITASKPILIKSSLKVKEGVKLTVSDGAIFYFRRNARFDIYGTVDMQGTADKPIILRGDRFDKISQNIYWDNVPGQWDGITFGSDSYNNILKHVVIKNTTKGVLFLESDATRKKATLSATTIQNSSGNALLAIDCNIDAVNCLLANSGEATLKLAGGKYNFNFCTIANYYRWSTRKASALVISNLLGMNLYPLTECKIYNSIIYGYHKEELSIEGASNTSFNYKISTCLIKGSPSDKSNFENVKWNSDPLFVNLSNNGDYFYSFELEKDSPAIDTANDLYPATSDIKGRIRPNNGKSDIGCYEWYAN